MRKILAPFVLVLALAPAAGAQTITPADFAGPEKPEFNWTPRARSAAALLSNATLGAELGIETWGAFKSENPKHALLMEGCRLGVAQGAAQLSKLLIHRWRPDHSDDNSFFSGHTAPAFAGIKAKWEFSLPLAVGTGYLRMAAAKHYLTDVLTGAAVGVATNWVCK